MSAAARSAEADRVEHVYYWALNQIGNAVAIEASDLFTEVPASKQAANAHTWLKAAVDLVAEWRGVARDLALSYYRLVRALRTGSTIADPRRSEKDSVSLEDLRDQFEAIVDRVDRATGGASGEPVADDADGSTDSSSQEPESAEDRSYDADAFNDDDSILLEEIEQLEREMDEAEDAAEKEAILVMDQLGIEAMLEKLERAEQEERGEELAREAYEVARRRQAAAASRISMNAARGLPYSLAEHDGRIVGWVRYSRTGTPCGWCAMLISRGVVYKNAKSAGSSVDAEGNPVEDADKYHDNCRCVAVPVFDLKQYDTPLFDLNRFYAQLWQDQIAKGKWQRLAEKDSDDLLTVWRRLVRRLHAEESARSGAESSDPPAAQAAA